MLSFAKLAGGQCSPTLLTQVTAPLAPLCLGNSVRHRYFADKPKILMRKYGYKDKVNYIR